MDRTEIITLETFWGSINRNKTRIAKLRKIRRKEVKIKIEPEIKKRIKLMVDKYIEQNMSENDHLKEEAIEKLSKWFGGLDILIPESPEKIKGVLPQEAYFWIGVLRGLGVKRAVIPPKKGIKASREFLEKVYETLWDIMATTPSPRGRNRGWLSVLKEKGFIEKWIKESGKSEEEIQQIVRFFIMRIKPLLSYERRKKKK